MDVDGHNLHTNVKCTTVMNFLKVVDRIWIWTIPQQEHEEDLEMYSICSDLFCIFLGWPTMSLKQITLHVDIGQNV